MQRASSHDCCSSLVGEEEVGLLRCGCGLVLGLVLGLGLGLFGGEEEEEEEDDEGSEASSTSSLFRMGPWVRKARSMSMALAKRTTPQRKPLWKGEEFRAAGGPLKGIAMLEVGSSVEEEDEEGKGEK